MNREVRIRVSILVSLLCIAGIATGSAPRQAFADPGPGIVIASFASPGSYPGGLAWDGQYLWNADDSADRIYKLNPSTGSVITSFASPGRYPFGLAWDGQSLWNADPHRRTIYKLNPSTGSVITSFASPGPYPMDLTWDGQYLWCADNDTNRIYKLNPSTGSVITSFASPEKDPHSLAWDGQYLWNGCPWMGTIYKLNPSTGSVITSFASPGGNPAGLTWDGQYLWCADYATDMIYKIDVAGAPQARIVGFVNNYEPNLPSDILTYLDQAFQIGMGVYVADVELSISIEGAEQIKALCIAFSTQNSRVYNLSELELSDGVYELRLRFGKPVSDVAEEMAWFIMDVLPPFTKGLGPVIFFPLPGETIYPYAEVIEQIVLIDKQGQEIHCDVQDILIPSVYYGFFSTWVKRNGEYELHSQYLVGDYGYGVWASPADLLIIDPQDRRIGTLYEEGMDRQILHEVPGALYSGPEEEPEFILIADPNVGDEYILRLTGTGEGQGSLMYGGYGQTIPSTFEEEEIYISQGGQREYRMNFIPPVSATIDIDPDVLYLGSQGKWITCYIELPEGYNVNSIDASTVRLNGFTSAEDKPTEVGDYDDDGILDLMVKFNRSSVQEILEPGDQVKINVRGKLVDGTLFKGTDTITVIEGGRAETAATHEITQPKFDLSQNYPNPFNPATTIEYDIAEGSHVTLKIYSLSGQLVRTLVDEFQSAGHHTITWYGDTDTGGEVASGVYFYHIKAGDFVSTKKMVVLK